jgi:tetratricopeptide (TPR) repeat protein
MMLAQLYVRSKRSDEARREFERIVERDPSAVSARTMVGMLFEAQNNLAEAEKWYAATVASSDKAPVAANNLAYIYAEEGLNLDIALQLATSAKQRLPDNPDVDDTLGWIYFKKNLPALAVGPFQESLKKRSNRAEVLYHLGLTYAMMGDKSKASEALARALSLDANFSGSGLARQTLASVTQ